MTRGRGGRPWRRIVAQAKREMPKVCHLCREPIDMALPRTHPMSWTLDHVVPLSLGGNPESLANLRPAHRRCNSRKGASTRPPDPPTTSQAWY